jgi:hypothetical protein
MGNAVAERKGLLRRHDRPSCAMVATLYKSSPGPRGSKAPIAPGERTLAAQVFLV